MQRINNKFRLTPLQLAIVTMGCSTATFAQQQQDATLLPTIEVVATANQEKLSSKKQPKPLLDTPQTVSVIKQDVFHEQGAQNLTDVLKNTPGISFNAGENGFSTDTNNFSLRGFDTSGSIFIDGVRDSGNYSRDIFNTEQVEVIKGPSGENGRGGASGYINMVTKSPKLENFVAGSTQLTADEYDTELQKRVALDINQRVAESTAVRLNVFGVHGGVSGREHAEQQSWGVAPSIAFGLGTETTATLQLEHFEQRNRPDLVGIPAAAIKGMLQYDPKSKFKRETFYGLAADFDDVDASKATFRLEHELTPNIHLSNQTQWSQTKRKAIFTVPTGFAATNEEVTLQRQAYDRKNDNLNNQTNAQIRFNTGDIKHIVNTGVEFSREESEGKRFGTVNLPASQLNEPNYNYPASNDFTAGQISDLTIDTIAGYLYDNIDVNNWLQLNGGARVEHYKLKVSSKNADGSVRTTEPNHKYSKTTVSGKVGAVVKPAENGSLYGSVGIAALPPGAFLSNPDISRTDANGFPGAATGMNSKDSKVQQAINYELGTKWDLFDNRLSTAAALFYTERRNVAISGADDPTRPVPTTNNNPSNPNYNPVVRKGYGKQIVKGIELSAAGKITDAWEVFAGVAYMDSERKHSEALDVARRVANPGDYATYTRTNGDELAFTPKLTGNLWTTYRLPYGLTVGGGVRYVDDSYIGRPDDAERMIPNGKAGKLPSYTVYDVMTSYAVDKDTTLRFNVNNVTDKLHAVSANWAGSRVVLGAPRTYMLSLDFKF
ncbi:TonB-dependent siderophore receptor [Acinetobacter sp. NIPH 2699]|uniref:TonB-dependent receptor n=1 Tax=Acinetobacter sp. NIPH 2699 TaxID=2923433 RepID=UPI001F4B466C|nr:TonB-dependent siderophore receptor [Acinetobacter sp. NIPH 2699]MCH7335966.1 TonB-dependent siderophore receptor [Acinetobacter sp. NIPH 2699]